MPNQLADQTSPYLLQHAENPVNWYPWNETAMKKAVLEDKPIFLSIGYAACHWCHVMAHESFEDPFIADILNEHFISIKVDREERPDIDSIYMTAVVAMTGQGGWPMSVFLTPEGKPFYGGTYFPPTSRYGMPAFSDVLRQIADLWKTKRDDLFKSAQELTQHIQQTSKWGVSPKKDLSEDIPKSAFEKLSASYDWGHGGWGSAPRFPAPMTIEFLLSRASRGNQEALRISEHFLQTMSRGGLYDVVGGGFHRYSTDNEWLVPHFEKMLYDNAQLARVYLHAYLLTGNIDYRRICEETLNFILREMTSPEGGFFSSLDADSEGQEGKFYVWTLDQIETALPDPNDREFLFSLYPYPPGGNFEGKIIFQTPANITDVKEAEKLKMPLDMFRQNRTRIHQQLLLFRDHRQRPPTDDKVLVFWNALTLRAFAEAARYLKDERYLKVAQTNAAFLLENLFHENNLYRSWRNGTANVKAFLEDYASFSLALLSLYQTDLNNRWYEAASKLTSEMQELFTDPEGGFFNTPSGHETLIVRPKEYQDNATPSANALAVFALLQLSTFNENMQQKDYAIQALSTLQTTVSRYPTSFSCWLQAIDFAISPIKQVALVWPPQKHHTLSAYQQQVWEHFQPHLVLAGSEFPLPHKSPALLENRHPIADSVTAYVCEGFVCKQPVTTLSELKNQLEKEI